MNVKSRSPAIFLLATVWVVLGLSSQPQAALAQQQVRTLQLATLTGEVIDVRVPDDIRPGDQITGSVVVPKDKEGKLSATLQGAVIEVRNEKTSVGDRIFTFAVPAGLSAIPLLIKDKGGRTIAETTAPVNVPTLPTPAPGHPTITAEDMPLPELPTPGTFGPMNYGQPDRPLTVNGNFDGNAQNTQVTVGGQPAEVIAESPRASFVQVPEDLLAGPTTIEVEESGVREEFPFQVVSLSLTADKTTLLRGESAAVNVTVTGLENLNLTRDRFRVDLANLSPSTVRFRETSGNVLTRNITPASARTGTFSYSTRVEGIEPGSYTLTATVTSSTCTDCWEQYERCLSRVRGSEERCYRNCDRSQAGTGCYLACSAAARAQELECWAQYIGCFRKKLFGL